MNAELQSLFHFALLAFGLLFVIIDPLASVPAFLAMTPRDTPGQRIRMARLASLVMAVVCCCRGKLPAA
jgi:multiple antibiotic resistance protein